MAATPYVKRQVNVDIADAMPVKLSHPNEVHDLVVCGDAHRAQLLQQFERCLAVREVPAGELAYHEGMDYNLPATKILAKLGESPAKVVNPN